MAPKQSTAGIFTGLAIALHNLPEGLATFVGALNDTKVGASIAAAIFIHNVSWAGLGGAAARLHRHTAKFSLFMAAPLEVSPFPRPLSAGASCVVCNTAIP